MSVKYSGLNPEVPYLSKEKEEENFCVVLTYSIKRAHAITKFHVTVVQEWLRNVQKSMMLVQSCSFANLNLLLFCCLPLPLPLQILPIVVIQKFCYHGNMTSHFSSLLCGVVKCNYLMLVSMDKQYHHTVKGA